ncbi:uncharacterized protein PHALS_13462 [Plasmopara halstedii]|uniref:BAT2 N-terminal domain-containing protein n=1 Tax=Plasmopara halstedii TaxID=4781 RepID=A0A0P1AQB2_PLAHL|nr:uncharacterized protein PHALS_13462 [Plasmopara halstedii]CEG43253.1 hypothetical protein PHALS_13462 [Plasmopara halstedii]|eukprot:XP_024579622.1 hypothetical protein PHALS_13462 [Plasmopara halstedii]
MNKTTNAKPRTKFSSRNLSIVYKAPLRGKPLPDHATGPLQRLNSRMIVLGRTSVAPPAPLNTPSLKKEGQVHNVRVRLVPAGSNWAENAGNTQKAETSKSSIDDVRLTASLTGSVWTPESVAENVHDTTSSVRNKPAAKIAGRWGDDAAERDIGWKSILSRTQTNQEMMEFSNAEDNMQKNHTNVLSSPNHLEHDRLTDRWAQSHHEMPRLNSLLHSYNDLGEERYGFIDHPASKCEDASPCGYNLQNLRISGKKTQHSGAMCSKSNTSIFCGSHTHCNASNPCFDTMATGNQSYSVEADGLAFRNESMLNYLPASTKVSLGTGSITLSSSEQKFARNVIQPENDDWYERDAGSPTDLSDYHGLSHDAERPKMLFDPKTGAMVLASEKRGSAKRKTGGQTSVVNDHSALNSETICKQYNGQSQTSSKRKFMKSTKNGIKSEEMLAAAVENLVMDNSNIMKAMEAVVSTKVCKQLNENVLLADKCKEKRISKPPKGKPIQISLSCRQISNSQHSVACTRTRSRPNNDTMIKREFQKGLRSTADKQEMTDDESSENASMPFTEQEGTSVGLQDHEFETVKSRRAVQREKKEIRERLASMRIGASALYKYSSTSAIPTNKGKHAPDNCGSAVNMQVTSKYCEKSVKTCNNTEKAVKAKKVEHAKQATRPKNKSMSAKADSSEGIDMFVKTLHAVSQEGRAKLIEQVAGEAPVESPGLKKIRVASATKKKREQNSFSYNQLDDRDASTSKAEVKTCTEICDQMSSKTTKRRRPAASAKPKHVRHIYVAKTPASSTSTAA